MTAGWAKLSKVNCFERNKMNKKKETKNHYGDIRREKRREGTGIPLGECRASGRRPLVRACFHMSALRPRSCFQPV